MKAAISEATHKRTTLRSVEEVVERVNRILLGWGNYFCLGPVSNAYKAIDNHTASRLYHKFCSTPHRASMHPLILAVRQCNLVAPDTGWDGQ